MTQKYEYHSKICHKIKISIRKYDSKYKIQNCHSKICHAETLCLGADDAATATPLKYVIDNPS